MKRLMRIPFAKLEGLGNDFIVTSPYEWQWRGQSRSTARQSAKLLADLAFLSSLAKAICERHTGVGADGLLLVLSPEESRNHARVRFFNADGGEAEMSGNGIRCAAASLMLIARSLRKLRIETLAGVRTLERIGAGTAGAYNFRVAMGRPILEPSLVPFLGDGATAPVVDFPLITASGERRVTVTSMGNPHCSLFVPDFDSLDWPRIGREIETHPSFPNRTNVEFVRVVSRDRIEVRFWERGVGVTSASGTGSCGAVTASILNGFTARRARVATLGGELQVEWPEDGEVILTGPARMIATGDYAFAWDGESRAKSRKGKQ